MFRSVLMGAAWLFPLVLLLLFLVKGRYYDADIYLPSVMESAALPMPVALSGWVLETPEFLPADRMYEKINGKSGYYEQYGAEGLYSGEWVLDAQRWDMYLYSFKTRQGALGAFNGERPSDGTAIDGVEGYAVPGQAAVSIGRYYLQLNALAAEADPGPAVELALALAPCFREAGPDSGPASEIDLMALAGQNFSGDAEGLMPENAFGFTALDNVRTVEVSLKGDDAVWFTLNGDAGTVAAYAGELAMVGGEALFTEDGASGGSMFGSWGMAGVLNGSVWGVQNATSREALMTHWNTLKARLATGSEAP
jgi:hypothetical protein